MERMRIVFVGIFLIWAISACRYNTEHPTKENAQTNGMALNGVDSCTWYSHLPRVPLPDSIGYDFIFSGSKDSAGSTYKIEWYRANGKKFMSKKDYPVLGNGTLNYLGHNEHAILFSQGCGTSCSYVVVLLLESGLEKMYSQPVALNSERNLIAYAHGKNDVDTTFLMVENFVTDERMAIKESNLCPSAIPVACIQCCYFSGNGLIVEWEGEDWKSASEPDLQRKQYEINLK